MEPESRDPVRDGSALRAMAQLANASPAPKSAPPRKPNADHSGLVDLSALIGDQRSWLDDALARAKAAAGTTLAPPALTPMSLAPTMTELEVDRLAGLPRTRALPVILACLGAGLLVAGACVFAIRFHRPAQHLASSTPVAATAVPVDSPTTTPPQLTAAAVPAPPAADTVTATGAAQAQATGTPDQAPAPEPEAAPSPLGRHGHHGRHEVRATEARFAAQASAPAASPVEASPAPARATPPPPHVGSALDAALRAAAGPGGVTPPRAPAAPDPAPAAAPVRAPTPAADGRPERPSGSAVTAALSAVLPNARKCVGQMSDASRALITFGPDGNVHKVDVSGPAASDSKAASCLRSAFGRAHVPPFSASTYAAGVTVRPE
jgi:hypothetical protein